MNDLPRQTLSDVVRQHGVSLCDDPRRCEGLLRDLCGEHQREIFVLVSALEEGVASSLLVSQANVPQQVLLARLSKRLIDNLAMSEDVAHWAVESWALALGVISGKDLKKRRVRKKGPKVAKEVGPKKRETVDQAKGAKEIEVTTPGAESSPALDEKQEVEKLLVSPHGGGTHTNLVEAIRDAIPGATIRLSAGDHDLDDILRIEKPSVLIGEGMDLTRLRCFGKGHGVDWAGTGQFEANDLAFVWRGLDPGNSVRVASGEVKFIRCRFAGSFHREGDESSGGGIGLAIIGNVRGKAVECEMSNNTMTGVSVSSSSKVALERNTCRGSVAGIMVIGDTESFLLGNECFECSSGIAFVKSSGGVAKGNICKENKIGIVVRDSSTPLLQDNRCIQNSSGIFYCHSSAGAAERNICEKNRIGIRVDDCAEPSLEGNQCYRNEAIGIWYRDASGGLSKGNFCEENSTGIKVQDNAMPHLQNNHCSRNSHGIGYENSSSGEAKGNVCKENRFTGIWLCDNATPSLEDNECNGNSRGIEYRHSSGGETKRNVCNENELVGILIRNDSEPMLLDNQCNRNRVGIWYRDSSGGEAKENICEGNITALRLEDTASPLLKDNECY